MKIIIKKNNFLNGLKFCNNIIGQNITYPILQSLFIEAVKNKIYLISSNGISSTKYIIDDEITVLKEGRVLIKLKTILNLFSKLEGDEVLLEKVDNSLLKINSNKFESNLNILDVNEYPNINFDYTDWKYIELNSKQLIEINKKIIPSVNNNPEKESIYNGILFDTTSNEGFIKIIGTDTYRLSYIQYPFIGEEIKFLIEPLIIKSLIEFLNNDNIYIFHKENKIIIQIKNILILTKNIEGTFPNVDKIVNQDHLYKFKISRNKLINLLNRGHSLISNENKPIADFQINKNSIIVSFKSMEIGFANESIEIESNIENKIDFSINILYVNSLLKSFENDTIYFYILEINKPILLKDPNDEKFIQVIVPLRKN